MAEDTLNYILLARHSVLLGYVPEVEALIRSCYERTTRCYLFFANQKKAHAFLSGEQISQVCVDSEGKKLLRTDKAEDTFYGLRKVYKRMSSTTHPNLQSLEMRYRGAQNLKERVGVDPVFGGMLTKRVGEVTIGRLVLQVLLVLMTLRVKFEEQAGEWDKEFKRIKSRYDQLVAAAAESIAQH